MLRTGQRLRHRIRQLELRLDRVDGDLPELHHFSNVVIRNVYVFCPIWLTQSAGPFFTAPIIFIYNNVIWSVCFEC